MAYKIISVHGIRLEEVLNEREKSGWQMVQILDKVNPTPYCSEITYSILFHKSADFTKDGINAKNKK